MNFVTTDQLAGAVPSLHPLDSKRHHNLLFDSFDMWVKHMIRHLIVVLGLLQLLNQLVEFELEPHIHTALKGHVVRRLGLAPRDVFALHTQ